MIQPIHYHLVLDIADDTTHTLSFSPGYNQDNLNQNATDGIINTDYLEYISI